MKILIGTESFYPNISGVAVFSYLLAKNLAKRGHNVFVIAPSQNEKYFEEDLDGFGVYRVESKDNPWRKGFKISKRPLVRVKRILELTNPDIIHLQDPTYICSELLRQALRKNIPVVISNHFSLVYLLSYVQWAKLLHPVMKLMLSRYLTSFYNKTKAVFCPTEYVAEELKKRGVKVPIVPISNGVAVERFYSYTPPGAIRLKYHLPNNPIVLYVGRLDEDKDIITLIKAIPNIIKESKAHFVFCGDGRLLDKLRKVVNRYDLENFTSFIGPIPHESEELPMIYQIADVFVIPSPAETQSIVTLEAMASGLPIVAAKAGALPELVKDGVNGFLFSPGDPEDMAKKVLKILKDIRLREAMSKQSLEVVAKHRIEESVDKFEEIYKGILDC